MMRRFCALLIGLMLTVSSAFSVQAGFSTDGAKSSSVNLDKLTSNQQQTLEKTGKVWGYLKYHHPAITSGKVDWDAALIRELPALLKAKNQNEVNARLTTWFDTLGKLPNTPAQPYTTPKHLSWITNRNYIGQPLRDRLTKLSKQKITAQHYIQQMPTFNNAVYFSNENLYANMKPSDDGYKLIALYRFWNVIEYFYPHRNILSTEWNNVLSEYIPKLAASDSAESYAKTAFEMSLEIQDNHAYVQNFFRNKDLASNYGMRTAPLKLEEVEGKMIVREMSPRIGNVDLKKGDTVVAVDGVPTSRIMAYERSNVTRIRAMIDQDHVIYTPVRTNEKEMTLSIERLGERKEVTVPTVTNLFDVHEESTEPAAKWLDTKTAYINPKLFSDKEDIAALMETYKGAEGIVIDLRFYPNSLQVFDFIRYFTKDPNPFVNVYNADILRPGTFVKRSTDIYPKSDSFTYTGKVKVLVGEYTVSRGEYLTMALMEQPNVEIIGVATLGSNGSVGTLVLPGNIITTFTSFDMRTVDGRGTQRVGIQPDVRVPRTIAAIQKGIDEQLQVAIERMKEK
ncbi:MAG: S41 family peptidase [Bacilli bacterium]